MKELGLTITWKFLYLAICMNQVLPEEVIEYAIEKLDESDSILLYQLAGLRANEEEEICALLLELVELEKASDDTETRKIRALHVAKILEKKNENYIDGLMDLEIYG